MRYVPLPTLSILFLLACAGCEAGYDRVDGQWAWVSYDEAMGRRVTPIDVDPATFEVLHDQYAADREHVYFEGRIITGASPPSFSVIEGKYSKDREHVYYGTHPVHGADPQSFELLGFPYSRDATDVYCGTVPLGINTPSQFEVVREEGMVTTTTLQHLRDDALADSLRARGLAPPDTVVVASTFLSEPARGRVGDVTIEGCRRAP